MNWTPLLWFGAILALIPLLLWLVRRTSLDGRAGAVPLRSVAVMPLSASQRVAIVEVGSGAARRWLVLGIGSQSITTLHTMEPQVDAMPDAAAPSAAFAQLLSRLQRDK